MTKLSLNKLKNIFVGIRPTGDGRYFLTDGETNTLRNNNFIVRENWRQNLPGYPEDLDFNLVRMDAFYDNRPTEYVMYVSFNGHRATLQEIREVLHQHHHNLIPN